MSDTAFQTMYREEFIRGFEKRQALARESVTTEALIKGKEAVFLVADSGGATATTRGVDGNIPERADNLNQYTVPLVELHDLVGRTGFNIFASQGNARAIMQTTTMAVINRTIDNQIHTALTAATNSLGAAATASMQLVQKAKVRLENAFADEDQVFALITPAFHAYLMGLDQFTSVDYVNGKRFEGVSKSKAFNWYGVNWIVDAGLPGAGTNTAQCFMYAKSAVGHAVDSRNIQTYAGYDEKHDKSWQRVSVYMGAKLIQNSGVIKIIHDDSALSA